MPAPQDDFGGHVVWSSNHSRTVFNLKPKSRGNCADEASTAEHTALYLQLSSAGLCNGAHGF
jgi:hypothetical protein